MFKRIVSVFLSFLITVPCCGAHISSADDTVFCATGGIWQSPDELPEDCGITVVDCENVRSTRADIPQSADVTTNPDTARYFPPIGNQGQMNSCAGWSTTYYQFTYELNKYRETPTDDSNIMSPSWTYNYINGGQNASVPISDAYSVLMNQGAMTLADYPHSSTASTYSYEWSTDTAKMLEALRYRATGFLYTVNSQSDDSASKMATVKSEIADGHIAVVWTNISGWSVETNSKGENFIVRGSSRSKYGHFMTVVGYDDNIKITVNGVTLKGAFKVANSMGVNWANDGYIWVSYDALNYTSAHGTAWQNKYKGTRTAVFSSDNKNSFYFIDIKECDVAFAGYIQYISNDPWDLYLKAGPSFLTPTLRWCSDTRSRTANPSYRCLVFDYFSTAAINNMNKYLSVEWIVKLTGSSDNGTYRIMSCVIDNLGNPIVPIDTVCGSMTDGVYSRTTEINLAKGRVTAYDDSEITYADSELVMNYIVNNAVFSNLQKFLADYNGDGIVNVSDVVQMNQHIAERKMESSSDGLC